MPHLQCSNTDEIGCPTNCLSASPWNNRNPSVSKENEVENLVSHSQVLPRVADICTDKSFTWDEDTPKEQNAGIFHFLN